MIVVLRLALPSGMLSLDISAVYVTSAAFALPKTRWKYGFEFRPQRSSLCLSGHFGRLKPGHVAGITISRARPRSDG